MRNDPGFRQGISLAFKVGTELTVATMIGALLGYGLDSFFNTRPWFLALGVIMGGAAGCLNVYRTAQNMIIENDNNDKPDAND